MLACMSIDAQINTWFEPLAKGLADAVFYAVNIGGHDIMLILVWLVIASLFFTVYLGFINVRYFKHALCLLFEKDPDDKKDGQISRFQALATSLSGTDGLGTGPEVLSPSAAATEALAGSAGVLATFCRALMACSNVRP